MADISKGTTFVDGSSYHATSFNNLVDDATILPAFVSAKPATSPATDDKVLLYDASGTALIAPTVADVLDLQIKDAAAGTASMRTLGTSNTQAAQGNLVAYLGTSQTFTGVANKFKHIGGTSGVTIAVNVAGAGTGATASLSSGATDISGQITLNTGTGVATSTLLCTITFASAYSSAPGVMFVPVNTAAWQTVGTANKAVVVASTTTAFTLTSGSVAIADGTTFTFRYAIFGS